MKKNIKTKKLLLIASFLFLFLLSPSMSFAADNPEKEQTKISVSPSVIKISAKKGEKIERFFYYINNTGEDQIIKFDILPFVPSEKDSGSPVFYDDNGNPVISPSKDWIEIKKPDDYVILSGDRKKIDFSVNIPENAESKKYYNAIFVESNGKGAENLGYSGNIINYRIGVLVILDVAERAIEIKKITGNWQNILYIFVIVLIVAILLFIVKNKTRKGKELRKAKKK